MYHLPLLPGYGPAAKVRSSVPAPSHTRRLSRMSQAEEDGYRDLEENEVEGESRERGFLVDTPLITQSPTLALPTAPVGEPRTPVAIGDDAAEIVFFAYGVAVFFGFDETQERDILEDVHGAGTVKGARAESEWEIEECHYAVSRFPPFLSFHLAQVSS